MLKETDTPNDSLSVHSGWGKLYQQAKKELNLSSFSNSWRTTPSNRLYVVDLRNDLHALTEPEQSIPLISKCAKSVNPFTFGCFSLLFWTSPCIKTALKNSEDYSILMSNPIHLQSQTMHNGDIEIWFIDNETSNHNSAVSHLGILLYILTLSEMLQRLIDHPISPLAIELASPDFTDKQIDTIKKVSNVSLSTNKTRNKLCIPHELLQIGNPYYDEDVYHSQLTLARDKTSTLKKNDIIINIFNYLDSMRDLTTVSVETTANYLAMSVRTLNRKLNNQNTTYRDVLTNYRIEKSLRLLSDNALNVTEIAFHLGFADVSSFSRAFKGWTGTTPLKLRST
ncbi:helix-turn-helix transcriptional regulator [Vibrio parahaemolyticus]|uniref:helix-turn-helix domain-containing protein n=1 Tax=Vibrio parahaemolyticus TaxID=670 RepID=UPI0004011CF8|nr:helix-turn-helix transcriptional regulator [Vibrio parahaemolyticus]EGR7951007.1 helix-turn-helix transcriptional regulator [Vibrio vulnificus]EGQ8926227.1 helix-turn-helix domain-containing protein [Vibrio parahaemolyticus]EGR2947554.1 AraC family transcriptional regulator [Vibrio parahaemolyticus]EGR3065271.1 AraC family transcriptional regulator [Vibrio parahaemolyticus]EHH1216897.1 helix-turn-helix transcriptional regulator [Vibrio parahaemolyticus]